VTFKKCPWGISGTFTLLLLPDFKFFLNKKDTGDAGV
jgi:hypothetical protein